MANPEFVYQDPLPLEKDTTQYRLLTREHVAASRFEGKEILKIQPEGLRTLKSFVDSLMLSFNQSHAEIKLCGSSV